MVSSGSAASAARVIVAGAMKRVPAAGAVKATLGGVLVIAVTVTAIAAEVVAAPRESVALAVSV